jgi:hypothetical protein
VPYKVTRQERPERQLKGCETQQPQLAQLVKRCWRHEPSERPSFEEIRDELERQLSGMG